MDAEFADLLPLFIAEAQGRLERLAALAPTLADDEQAAAPEIRRELHTLKGAGRMLRLMPFAELCHAAEGLLQPVRAGVAPLLARVVDRLTAIVEAVGRGDEGPGLGDLLAEIAGTVAAAGVPSAPDTTVRPAATPAPDTTVRPAAMPAPGRPAIAADIRVDATTIDALADRATRLRLLALSAEQTVDRLYELAQLAEKSVREEQPGQVLAALATTLRRSAAGLEGEQRKMLRATELQLETLLGLQVQPLRGFLVTLARHARELARSLGREVDVELAGEETRLDRRLVHELEDALLHLLRNAVDHGIETPERRVAAGKPRTGRLRIEARASGGRVALSLRDDGAGVDTAAVAAAAVAAGLVEAASAATMNRDEVMRLLFLPGFSTREAVSEVSGRGVGLDAVAAAAARAGGTVRIESEPGAGTQVTIEVPAAKRGEIVVLVRVGALRLAIPASAVTRVDAIRTADALERDGRTLAPLGDALVAFVPLARALGEEPAAGQYLLQGEVASQPLRVAVDAVEGSQEVIVRPLTRAAAMHPFVDGVALLASGQPVAVLSPLALARRDATRRPVAVPVRPAVRRLRLLLVDDSLVTRQMERRLLEDAGFDVVAAEDAAEALARLAEQEFDCLVTDVEMPGMDGFELTRHLRSIPHLRMLPVIVVSTRDRPEDRLRGLEAGADGYLTKQGLDAAELTSLVRRLAGR